MQSLRDKNKQKHTKTKIAVSVLALIVIVLLVTVFPKIGNGFRTILKPFAVFEQNSSENLHLLSGYFASKKALLIENDHLKQKIVEQQTLLADREAFRQENIELKEILNRKDSRSYILGSIITKPSRSLYDTLVIDAGKNDGVTEGSLVYAFGSVPIGTITQLSATTSIATLFSTAGQKTNGRVMGGNIDIELVGRGGGNFEIKVPRDVILEPGTTIMMPGVHTAVIATIAKNITDPRDPAQTFLLTAPVNVNELSWVQILK